MSEQIAMGVIAFGSGAIGVGVGSYFMLKKIKTDLSSIVLELIDEITPELPKLLAKDEVRQFVYSLGVLAGNGAKAGALGGVKSGKFKFEDILGMVIPQLLPKIFPAVSEASQATTPVTGAW